MDDACVATFNSRSDDVLDESTGKVIPGSPVTLYDETTTGAGGRSLADDDGTGGKCKVTKASNTADSAGFTEEGGETTGLDLYRFSTPWDAPVLPIGAVVKITSSRRDPDLVGQEIEIKRPIFSTFLINRRYMAALRVAVPT